MVRMQDDGSGAGVLQVVVITRIGIETDGVGTGACERGYARDHRFAFTP